MINKLENLFQNSLTTTFNPNDTMHFWFKTDDDQVFGLLKSEISDIEINLIRSLFSPINEIEHNSKKHATHQEKWFYYLFKDAKVPPCTKNNPNARFFYFYLKQPIDDLSSFKEALAGIFQQPVIIMLSHTHGIIIDEKPTPNFEQQVLDQLNSTLLSDFLVEIYSYIGQIHTLDLTLKEKFTAEYNYFQAAHRLATVDKSKTFYEVLPLLLIHSPTLIHKNLLSNKLIDMLQNEETLQTIQVFLQCNLNASLTAKKLFIHRNSLQYRLDKFVENTGLDIRSFTNASFISLAIPLINSVVE